MNKIIISDTSCLIALSNIGKLHILKDLFQEVLITKEVQYEFGEPLPDWIIVKYTEDHDQQSKLEQLLDKGEASSITLALETQDSMLIIDEMKGRKVAQSFHLDMIGTIGLILLAAKMGIINDVMSVVYELTHSGFRISDHLLNRLKNRFEAP